MATKQVVISDLSGDMITDDSDAVTIVVLEHPQIEQPVSLDASKADVKSIGGSNKDFVILEVLSDGGDSKERVVLELADFDKLFKGDADEVLSQAPLYGRQSAPVIEMPRRGRPPAAAKPTADKVNYKELPAAGLPHRGRTTHEEAETVRNNLDEVNKNRVAAGHPPIDPMNDKDAARYGFDAQKPEDRPKLSPEFKA